MLTETTVSSMAKDLRSLKNDLRNFIEPDYGLLNVLLSRDLIKAEQQAIIRSKGNVFEKCDLLLDMFIGRPTEDCEKFLSALTAANQEHVVNYIILKGRKYAACLFLRRLHSCRSSTMDTRPPRMHADSL